MTDHPNPPRRVLEFTIDPSDAGALLYEVEPVDDRGVQTYRIRLGPKSEVRIDGKAVSP